jgi:tetratricopeptide (TPR) repeat protein
MPSESTQSNHIQTVINHINAQEFINADKKVNALINNKPNSVQLWHLKSITTNALGRLTDCEFCLNKALSFDPNFIPVLINLAKLQQRQNWLDEAIKNYLKVVTLDKTNIDALFNLGVLLNNTQKFIQAEIYLESAYAKNSANINITLAYGQSLLNQDKNQAALELFSQILQTEPMHLAALNNKGIALKKLCYWEQAITVLQQALKIAPEQAEVIKNLASCYTLSGNYKKSKLLYQQALKNNELDRDAHHWLNQLLWENKDEEFLDSYKYAIDKHPQSTELLFDMGHKLNLSKDYHQAKTVLEQAIKTNPKHSSSLIELGVVLRELNQLEQSQQVIKKAYLLDKNNISAKIELGKSYISCDQAEKAVQTFNELLFASPNQPGLLAYKSIALKLLGSAEYDYLCNYDHLLITDISLPNGYKSIGEFNNELVSSLRTYHHAKTNPLDQSLVSGSQTSEKLFDYHIPIIQELRQCCREQTLAFLAKLPKDAKHPLLSKNTDDFTETDSWSVILHDNGFHKNHHHTAGWYSGPYYAQLPDVIKDCPDKQGWVKFGQPGFNMMTELEPDIVLQPTEGMMIRFPSYFWHGTIPFQSAQERITVTGDIIPV